MEEQEYYRYSNCESDWKNKRQKYNYVKEVNGEIEHVKANVSGVYFIYLLEKDGTYSLLYIGEATSIRTRLEKHRVKSMEEKNKPNEYSLRRKILIESGLNI